MLPTGGARANATCQKEGFFSSNGSSQLRHATLGAYFKIRGGDETLNQSIKREREATRPKLSAKEHGAGRGPYVIPQGQEGPSAQQRPRPGAPAAPAAQTAPSTTIQKHPQRLYCAPQFRSGPSKRWTRINNTPPKIWCGLTEPVVSPNRNAILPVEVHWCARRHSTHFTTLLF